MYIRMYVCTYVLCNSAVFIKMPRLSDQGRGEGDIFERHLRTPYGLQITDYICRYICNIPAARGALVCTLLDLSQNSLFNMTRDFS